MTASAARQSPHWQKPVPSTVSLRHAGSLTLQDEDGEDEVELRRLPGVRRGVTFSDDEDIVQEISVPAKPHLNRQNTSCSAHTIPSRTSGNTTARTSPLISLRAPDGEIQLREPRIQETGFRSRVRVFIMSQYFETFAGFVILSNFIAIIVETDARAKMADAGVDSQDYKEANAMLQSCDKANLAFLVFYATECLTRMYALRKSFFHSKWNIFDLVIVLVGFVGEVLEIVFGSLGSSNMEHFQVLRSLRMLRLLRAARVIISFKELYSLICGMSSCLRTLFWAAALVFLMLTMWSIIAVEYLHPYVVDLSRNGFYDDCTYCSQSFSNIMYANLTFFQIVSGDGWSDLARPLITNHPWTAALFVGVIFTMVFGMLNLITAVIVDTAAQARESDVMHMAAQKEYERKYAWENVANICVGMDTDNDGNITLDELKRATKEIPELSAQLSVMGVEFSDLQMVFDLLDDECNGKIPIGDFVNQMYKMQTHEHRTTHVFVKHYVEDIRKHVKMMAKISEEWSRQNSDDLAKEPETEPKNESPPWLPLLPSALEDKEEATHSSGVNEGLSSPDVAVLPQEEFEKETGLASSIELHAAPLQVKSWDPDEWDNHAKKKVESSPPRMVPQSSTCNSENDLEIGHFMEDDLGIDNAISQYQNNAFPVLSTAAKTNFAEQLIRTQDNTEQRLEQSKHGSLWPTLLDKNRQVVGSQGGLSSSKNR